MIKHIILLILVLQVLAVKRKLKINYYQQFLLPKSPTGTNAGGDVIVNLESLSQNDATIPLQVQLVEIANSSDPFTGNQLETKSCQFKDNKCSVIFNAPVLNASLKYSIRVSEETGLHFFNLEVIYSVKSPIAKGGKKNTTWASVSNVIISPKGFTNPGFKFYIKEPRNWTAAYKVTSSPAPNISSYDFSLDSIQGTQLNYYDEQSATKGGNVTFQIDTAGYYFLSFGLQISKFNSTTKYPISISFNYTDDLCPSGEYFDPKTGACSSCLNDQNSNGATALAGICDCEDTFTWDRTKLQCVACPVKGCPPPRAFLDDFGAIDLSIQSSQPKLTGLEGFIEQFNAGSIPNLRQND